MIMEYKCLNVDIEYWYHLMDILAAPNTDIDFTTRSMYFQLN